MENVSIKVNLAHVEKKLIADTLLTILWKTLYSVNQTSMYTEGL